MEMFKSNDSLQLQ